MQLKSCEKLAPWELPRAFSHLALSQCVHLIREEKRMGAG
jgi:hypothetical protein